MKKVASNVAISVFSPVIVIALLIKESVCFVKRQATPARVHPTTDV
jgi:hypothetical protein